MSSFTIATHAQLVVWHDDFQTVPPGPYPTGAYPIGGNGNPREVITNDFPLGTNTQNLACLFDSSPGTILNFGFVTGSLPTTGNVKTSLADYTLEFDVAVQGVSLNGLGGYVGPVIGLYGANSGSYYGQGLQTNVPVSFFPAAGLGYQHVSMNLAGFGTAGAALLNPTASSISFFIGFYIAGQSYTGTEEIDIGDVQIVMNTNPTPLPTLTLLSAKPGLRVFAQTHVSGYNQEGFGTVHTNQSWVGVATPSHPVSYAITIQSFDTVPEYSLFVAFVPGASPADPYGVFNAPNALMWNITHGNPFLTEINWKTNLPQDFEPNTAIILPTTSASGRGTWTLTFTNNTDGTVTAPDGTSGSFSLDPTVAADFANPLTIDFGVWPICTCGYGQWVDIGCIAITNVVDGNEYDDFTMNNMLNTGLWNPGFSFDKGSVIQVSTNTPYWVTWTLPDSGFGLGTKASLNGGTNVWFTPNYYGSGVGVTLIGPTQMGLSNKWTLIPKACLPTVEGTTNGPVSPTGFFRLSNPPPSE